jgi:hypothetical protein
MLESPQPGAALGNPFATREYQSREARPRPLTPAATEVRFLSQMPLTEFCNLSTRARAHQ